MSTLPPELEGLPPPSLIELIDAEDRFLALRAKLVQLMIDAGIDYDVETLETDPAAPLLQAAAWADTLLRQRINEAIRSWFLAYATGGDLDVLAQWYDVARLAGETDDALKRRVVLAIKGRSPGGTEPRYKSIALGASVRVADAAVYTIGRNPTVHVAVFSTDNGGVADASLLAKVDAALQNHESRMVNDTIVVASAAQEAVNVTARYWLLPDAPETIATTMETRLRAAWLRDMSLGRDVTLSWLLASLQVDGLQRVELVDWSDVEMPFNRAAALGVLTLTKMGRAY